MYCLDVEFAEFCHDGASLALQRRHDMLGSVAFGVETTTPTSTMTDSKVKDMGMAEFGRKELQLAEVICGPVGCHFPQSC